MITKDVFAQLTVEDGLNKLKQEESSLYQGYVFQLNNHPRNGGYAHHVRQWWAWYEAQRSELFENARELLARRY